jgi:hypothetical protein
MRSTTDRADERGVREVEHPGRFISPASRNPTPISTAPTTAGRRGPVMSWIRPAITITNANDRMQIENAYLR